MRFFVILAIIVPTFDIAKKLAANGKEIVPEVRNSSDIIAWVEPSPHESVRY